MKAGDLPVKQVGSPVLSRNCETGKLRLTFRVNQLLQVNLSLPVESDHRFLLA